MAVKKKTTEEVQKVDLLAAIKGTNVTVDISTFRASVLQLFSGIINEESVDTETRGKLARLRARIEIELKQL